MSLRLSRVSELIWKTRYRHADEPDIEASWRRVAHALASVEPDRRDLWERRFLQVLEGFRFLPGGRILAGAGTGRRVTLCNCFVMGRIEDDMASIFEALEEGALTMQQGGGVGYDFSPLRPRGLQAVQTGGVASGPVSFMRIWDSMCATLLSTARRRGAMMGTLRCDHPDILAFVNAKREAGELCNFNLSVLISDAFMRALERGEDWPLVFPVETLAEADRDRFPRRIECTLPGHPRPVNCAVLDSIPARRLWEAIMRACYDTAEPGVLFIDRIASQNNLSYRERISATNPCGEIPLPAYGACDLGSINLTAFVVDAFTHNARLDIPGLQQMTAGATRMLDDVIDLSLYPLTQQREQAQGSRRIGLGITGLADALILLGIDYRDERAREVSGEILRTLCHSAYRTSVELAREKGAFPFLDTQCYLQAPFIRQLPEDIRQGIARHGIRNSHLIAIAPAGTISLLAGNLSSGIEPVYAFHAQRMIKDDKGEGMLFDLQNPTLERWRAEHGMDDPPACFVTAAELTPFDHLAMQARLQPYVDNAVSKTVNVPAEIPFTDFQSIYAQAWKLGLKGCTAFRPNPVSGAVLSPAPPTEPRCCTS